MYWDKFTLTILTIIQYYKLNNYFQIDHYDIFDIELNKIILSYPIF